MREFHVKQNVVERMKIKNHERDEKKGSVTLYYNQVLKYLETKQ